MPPTSCGTALGLYTRVVDWDWSMVTLFLRSGTIGGAPTDGVFLRELRLTGAFVGGGASNSSSAVE